MLNHLDGQQKVLSGIALPAGMDKHYTGSKDETGRAWDTNSGQAWNTQTNQELSLSGSAGKVYTMVVANDLLFAGTRVLPHFCATIIHETEDGTILAWKFNAITNSFELAASLQGHALVVVSLVVGANRLYSGSMDHSIKVWSLDTLQRVQTLTEHSNVLMSLLCWEKFLLSCSLDQTIKVWAATENGNLEVTYAHNEEHGLLNLCGMHDSESKPVLLCTCNSLSRSMIYSRSRKGIKFFAKQEIRAIEVAPGGLFFTSDGTGFKVWKWAEPIATS